MTTDITDFSVKRGNSAGKKPNTSANSNHDAGGRFVAGNTAAKGRKPLTEEQKSFYQLMKAHCVDALDALIDVLQNPETKPEIRLKAAVYLIDRCYGRILDHKQDDENAWDSLFNFGPAHDED